MRSKILGFALWVLPVVVLLAAYHRVLDAWWTADDSMHLLSVIRFGVAAHFLRPLAELELTPSNLTPWLYASYGIDHALGGLDPRAAYMHHLLSWCATLLALGIALRRWLGPVLTAAVLAWFVLSLPTSLVVLLLCTRHYVEGLFAATLSVLAYSAYLRDSRRRYLALSALCYAFAMMAKEVYVPLGPVLIAHQALFGTSRPVMNPAGSPARAWLAAMLRSCRMLWPHIALCAAYTLYRGYMLGFDRLLAGYSEDAWETRPAMILRLPATWEWACGWTHWQSLAWLAVIGAGIARWLATARPETRSHGVAFATVVALSLLLPIYPVLGLLTTVRVNTHYLLLPLLGFLALAGWAAHECGTEWHRPKATAARSDARPFSRRTGLALPGCIALFTLVQLSVATRHAWPWQANDDIARYKVEGEYELRSGDRSLIVDAVGPAWHHYGLQRIRGIVLRLPPGPTACAAHQCATAELAAREAGVACVRYREDARRLERIDCAGSSAGRDAPRGRGLPTAAASR